MNFAFMLVVMLENWSCLGFFILTFEIKRPIWVCISEIIKKDVEINDLDISMVMNRTLWPKLIHVSDSI